MSETAKQIEQINFFKFFSFKNIVRFGFLLLIFSLAFLNPTIYIQNQRAAITDFVFAAVFTLWFVGIFLGQFKFRFHRFFWLLIFYLAAMILSVIFSPDLSRSGVKLFSQFYLIALAVMTFNLADGERELKQIITVWLAGTFLTVLVGIATILLFYVQPQNELLNYTTSIYGAVPVGNYPRVQSTFVSASMFCNYLTVSLAMLFVAERVILIGKTLFYALLALIFLCIIFTISSGIGGVFLFIGIWFWLVFKDSKKNLATAVLSSTILFALAFCVMNFIALQPYSSAPYSISIPFFQTVLYPSPRLLVWADALKTFKENFFVGKGLGLPSCGVLFQNTDGNNSFLTDAHNTVINVAAQNGFFGLLAILAITLYFLFKTFPLKKLDGFFAITSVGFLLAFFSAFIFQGLTGSFEDARHLWCLIGLILAVDYNKNENKEQ